jgi:DNA polymerase I-like protein with 3'-5' exonuclease and polymerase domains
MSLYALDIETACNVAGCVDKACKHALIPHLGRITCVGLWSPEEKHVFRSLEGFQVWLDTADPEFVLHNGKFDFKWLWHHGVIISEDRWVADTCLMATASYRKIPEAWLADYETKRKALGGGHRKAGRHSLKCLAPYHLDAPPFWETVEKDNDEYVLKDCEYTWKLYHALKPRLEEEGTFDFYEKRLLPWAKMFLRAEHRGVQIDRELLAQKEAEAAKELAEVKARLDEMWWPIYKDYELLAHAHIRDKYHSMCQDAIAKLKAPTPIKLLQLAKKYQDLGDAAIKKVEPFNLDSPKQLAWLLRDQLRLDIRGFDGKESTGVEVLERLDRPDLKTYLRYRELQKLVTAFFPTYRELQDKDGVIHCNFNLDIAKTGRTSSDTPNMQQCPADLHALFVARPGYKLITKDFSSIEPYLICYYSEDKILYDLLASGDDFHGYCANAIFQTDWDLKTLKKEHLKERNFAKECDLSVFYGAGGFRVQHSSQKHGFNFSEERAKAAVQRLRSAWPGVKLFKSYIDSKAESEPIEAILGRKRSFIDDLDGIYMAAFNSLIQGSASDLLLYSVEMAEKQFAAKGLDAHFLMSVHDEVIIEAREDQAKEADEILTKCLTGHTLTTQWGLLPLRVEGAISAFWKK